MERQRPRFLLFFLLLAAAAARVHSAAPLSRFSGGVQWDGVVVTQADYQALRAGAVPFSLGFLPDLRGVYLFNNRLSGTIPPSIGNCPLLQALDLSNNLLSGTIPPSLANSTKLLRLNLSFNAITGPIPSVVS